MTNALPIRCALSTALTLALVAACGGSDSSAGGPGGPDSGTDGLSQDSSPQTDDATNDGTLTDGSHLGDGGGKDTGQDAPGQDSTSDSGGGASCVRPLFPASAAWNQRADTMARDASSDTIIATLQGAGGWGGGKFQIDTSINVMCDPNNAAPRMPWTPNADYASPDCDTAPAPVPAGGHVEGETGYACTGGGDCHLLVIRPMETRLYEMWEASITGGNFTGACLAIWDLSAYSPMGRGDQCTSADAGGFPITALLFSADEVAAGHIDHAIRYILPNPDIQKKTYVRPATHATNSSGGANAVPYGARLRIRDDRIAAVLAALPNVYARTVAQALHDYGMFLSDGGTIALTAEDDGDTVAKWDNTTSNRSMATGLGVLDLAGILVTDFEMVDGGTRVPWNGNCTRTPITM